MNRVKKMNLDRKVRYVFNDKKDRDLADMVTNHYGSFINNTWDMKEALKFDQIVDECDLTVSQFLKKKWKRSRNARKA
jgi:hypothetical protein